MTFREAVEAWIDHVRAEAARLDAGSPPGEQGEVRRELDAALRAAPPEPIPAALASALNEAHRELKRAHRARLAALDGALKASARGRRGLSGYRQPNPSAARYLKRRG